jgi:hypothetical protein
MMDNVIELFYILNDSSCLFDVEEMTKEVVMLILIKPIANG